MRQLYEANPSKILDRAFRREFKDLLIPEEIRSEVVKRCGTQCGACGRQIRRATTLHLDHIKPMKNYPELEFIASNLQVLCSRCNVHKSAYDGDDWKEVIAARRKVTQSRRAKTRRASRMPSNE